MRFNGIDYEQSRLLGLDVFSGIGGISLALKPWVKTVAYCEIEPYCQAVLLERMQSNDLDIAPIWDDIKTLNREILDTKIDIIFGGFPCQDISVAGNGKGLEGERSSLFFEIIRLANEFQPVFIFLENSTSIRTRGLDIVGSEMARHGYDCRWGTLSAEDVGAKHLRERWFCLAYRRQNYGRSFANPQHDGSPQPALRRGPEKKVQRRKERQDRTGQLEGSSSSRMLSSQFVFAEEQLQKCRESWKTESTIPRNAHGVPYQVERIKSLGNSVVPQAVREAFIRLLGGVNHEV